MNSSQPNNRSVQDGIAIDRLVIDFSVYYAVQTPLTTSPSPPALLLALHGYGQNCERFAKIFTPLRQRNIVVIAPQAPNQFYVKMDPKIVGFTWLTQYQRDQSIADFVDYMHRLLDKVGEGIPYDPSRIFLLGFSQGVSMAYRFALRGGKDIAGLIACSADLPSDVAEKLPAASRFPVLLAHGTQDSMVPITAAQKTEAILLKSHFVVDRFFFPGGHEIPSELVEKIGAWLIAPER